MSASVRGAYRARRLTAFDHRNGHHSGRDRSCWRCTIRAWCGRTPAAIAPQVDSGPCGDPECYVLHEDPAQPIHPPWYVDSRTSGSGEEQS